MDTHTEKLVPLVSVTMVTYNRATYIQMAIESVLEQTYQNWELIIVDDGSTDETESIITTFQDPRIRYIQHQHNKGIHEARTEALLESRGKYIAVLDSDDLWTNPRKLETQVAFLEEHIDHSIVGTYIVAINATGKVLKKNTYYTDDSSIRTHILIRNQFAHSSVLMRASIVKTAGGYRKVALGEDLDLFLRLGLCGKMANIPEYFAAYRIHELGASRDGSGMARCVLRFIWKYRARYPNFLPAIAKSTLVLLASQVRDTRA